MIFLKCVESISRRMVVTMFVCMIGAFGAVENGVRTWPHRIWNTVFFRVMVAVFRFIEKTSGRMAKRKSGRK